MHSLSFLFERDVIVILAGVFLIISDKERERTGSLELTINLPTMNGVTAHWLEHLPRRWGLKYFFRQTFRTANDPVTLLGGVVKSIWYLLISKGGRGWIQLVSSGRCSRKNAQKSRYFIQQNPSPIGWRPANFMTV